MWYYSDNGMPCGTFDDDAIKNLIIQKEVFGSTLVWRAGMKTWHPLRETALSQWLPQEERIVESPISKIEVDDILKTNSKRRQANLAAIFGALTWTVALAILFIPAIIFGHRAFNASKSNSERHGRRRAIFAMCSGYSMLLVLAAAIIFGPQLEKYNALIDLAEDPKLLPLSVTVNKDITASASNGEVLKISKGSILPVSKVADSKVVVTHDNQRLEIPVDETDIVDRVNAKGKELEELREDKKEIQQLTAEIEDIRSKEREKEMARLEKMKKNIEATMRMSVAGTRQEQYVAESVLGSQLFEYSTAHSNNRDPEELKEIVAKLRIKLKEFERKHGMTYDEAMGN